MPSTLMIPKYGTSQTRHVLFIAQLGSLDDRLCMRDKHPTNCWAIMTNKGHSYNKRRLSKWKNRGGDIFARCAGVAQQHVPHPHFFIWHSTPSRSLRLTVVPRRETTWLTKQLNTWVETSCVYPLVRLPTKSRETVMKRNMTARFSKTSDSPDCNANLTKFKRIRGEVVLFKSELVA